MCAGEAKLSRSSAGCRCGNSEVKAWNIVNSADPA